MAYTQQQLDELKAMIAEGVSSTKYSDKNTVYRPLDELLRIKKLMEDELGENAGGSIVYPAFGKGLE
jgi:hypothetical protein